MPGQAQKELFHNEALALIDIAAHAAVEGAPLEVPPAAPQVGQCWIVAPGAIGEWSGKENQLASWTDGGWRFVAPVGGMQVWNAAAGHNFRWSSSGWTAGELRGTKLFLDGDQILSKRQPGVPSPSGGSIIDVEARQSIATLIATLKSHGLID